MAESEWGKLPAWWSLPACARKAAQDIGFVKDRHPKVAQHLDLYKFKGRRRRDPPVGASLVRPCGPLISL